MNKLEYLKIAFKNKLYNKLVWLISVFSIIDSKEKDSYYDYEPMRLNGVFKFYDPETKTLETINGVSDSETLFSFSDKITIDPSWIPNVYNKLNSTIGNLLVNAVLLTDNFGGKIPFMTGVINVKEIENQIADKIEDNDSKNPDAILVSEYIKFVDSVTYLRGISNIAVTTVTERTMVGPPGVKALRAKLIKEYGNKLTNVKTIVELEGKLKELDAQYLKDDPTFKKFLTGKLTNIARKKLYLTYGTDDNFNEDSDTVEYLPKALVEGYETDPNSLVSMFNSIRLASISRGMETQKGGLAAKIILRSTNLFTITEKDCKTKDTFNKVIKSDYKSLVGRTIEINGKSEHIDNIEQAKKYENSTINLRSPTFCKTKGNGYCEVCSGDGLSLNKNGLSLAVTEVSDVILQESLKKMHGQVLSVKPFDPSLIFS